MKFKKILVSLAIPLLVGALSSALSSNTKEVFEKLIKPSFTPPQWIFGPVWIVLYFLMGISLYRILKYDNDKKQALLFFGTQLFLNFLWSPVFFGLQLYFLSFIILILLIFFSILTAISFYNIDKKAGILFIPYIMWILFAAVLNFSIYLLNK